MDLMMNDKNEKALQESFSWARSKMFMNYNGILGYYQAKACLEHACGKKLLDMPCGDGTLTAMLAPAFEYVVGVDASIKHLELARKILPSVTFYETLIEEFETDERFDTITMLNVLEHVVDPKEVLLKAASLLNEAGIMLIHVPNTYAVNRRIAVLMGSLKDCEELSPFDIEIVGHRRSYNFETLKEEIRKAGLKVVKTGGIFYKMLSTPQMDWFLKNGLWDSGHGWGRTGMEKSKDWKSEFCRACYEYGKEHPDECNIIYACVSK